MSKNNKKMNETDLYRPIYEYFTESGYQVNSEVNACDVTAVKDDQVIIIELKCNLNMQLLIQAAKRQRISDLVYVAVPKPTKNLFSKAWKDKFHLLRRLELGLIFVCFKGEDARMEIVFHPMPFDRKKSKKINTKKRKKLINEINERHGDYNVGGSCGQKLVTAYRETAIHIACCLKVSGVLSPKQLKDFGTGQKTTSILNKNFYGWFEKVKRGQYCLSKTGEEELKNYTELVEYYMKDINKQLL